MILETKSLIVKYDNKEVLKDINIEVEEGDYLCIVGSNGSGKSTLLKTVLSLKEKHSGEIILNCEKTKVGYLPQQSKIQRDFPVTVFEVAISGLNKLFYTNSDKEKTIANLEKLGIANLKNESYQNLSGGQQQRVLLARAIANDKKILFMDEPITGLDPNTSKEFYELTKKLNKEKVTIVITTHDVDKVASYANKVLELDNKQVFFGKTEEYLKHKKEVTHA